MLVSTAVFIGLVVYASPAYRGTDQYWYVEDVTTILRGAAPVTHETYPFEYDDAAFGTKEGFVHNGPALYVWAGAARALGSVHGGILAVNTVCALLTALFVYLASLRLAPRREAALFALLVLFLPVAFWNASQDLGETFASAFVAAALCLVILYPQRFQAYIGAQVLLAIAASGRLFVAPLLIALPLGYALSHRESTPARRWAGVVGLVAAGLALLGVLLALMPAYFPALGLMGTIKISRSMEPFFIDMGGQAFSLAGFVGGLVHNVVRVVRQQLLVGARLDLSTAVTAATQLPTLVLAALTAWGLASSRTDRTRNTLMCLGLFAFACYFGFLALFQNQARYIVPMLPALVIGATAGLVSLFEKRTHSTVRLVFTAILVVAIAVSIIVDCSIATRFRQDSLSEAAARGRVDVLVEAYVPVDARVVLDTRFTDRWVADQALYPRPVFALSTDFTFTRQQYDGWFSEFGPTYLVADETSALPAVYGLDAIARCDGYQVFQLAPGGLSPD
jgi:4-amino-4-deoxy-L-arabinose transferase-like glycosyltransferase